MAERILQFEADLEGYLPYLFSLQFVLGFLQLLDTLRVVYYPLIHRATMVVRFDLGVSLLWPLLLLLGFWTAWVIMERDFKLLLFPATALVALPFLGVETSISIASIQAVVAGLWLHRNYSKFFTGIILLLSGIEAFSLLHWVVFVPMGWISPFEGVAYVETGLFYIATYFAPLLVLPLLFMWLLKPLISWSRGGTSDTEYVIEKKGFRRGDSFMLILVVCLAVVSAIYPYLPSVNPEGVGVGVDISYYRIWIEEYEGNLANIFQVARGSRPFFILVLHGFQRTLNLETVQAITFFPIILIPLLILSIYFLSYTLFKNSHLSILSSFFTLCGYHVTTGMYSYFLANILGLSFIFLSLGFTIKAIDEKSHLYLILAIIFGGLCPFTHPWTFDQYFISGLFAIIFLYIKSEYKLRIPRHYLIFGCIIATVIILQNVYYEGLTGVGAISDTLGKIDLSSNYWYDSIFTFRLLYGGTMSCWLLIFYAIFGVYLFRYQSSSDVYFLVFICLTSLIFLPSNDLIKSRLLYNIPIGMFSAMGFLWILNKRKLYKKLIVIYTSPLLIVNLFRSLANLVL